MFRTRRTPKAKKISPPQTSARYQFHSSCHSEVMSTPSISLRSLRARTSPSGPFHPSSTIEPTVVRAAVAEELAVEVDTTAGMIGEVDEDKKQPVVVVVLFVVVVVVL